MVILGTEFHTIDRYLIRHARRNKSKIIAIQGHILTQNLEKYLALKGKLAVMPKYNISLPAPNLTNYKKIKGFTKKIKKLPSSIIKNIKMYWKLSLNTMFNYYVFPFIFTGTIFERNECDALGFISGRSDAVICYDTLEIEATQYIVPKAKNFFLAKHPSTVFCRCQKNINQKTKKNLLILLSGHPDKELGDDKILRISETIQRSIKYLKPNELHLRFHPRTDKTLLWPDKLIKNLESFSKCKIIDAMKVSLPQSVCDYQGIIGIPSGSLRVARAACKNVFVVGLENCGDPMENGDFWFMGNAEGIKIIHDGENLRPEDLIPIPTSFDKRASVAETLETLINRHVA